MARGPFPSDKQDQFMVRFPDGMRDQLKAAAEANNRSMNAEIIARLSQSFRISEVTSMLTGAREEVQSTIENSQKQREELEHLLERSINMGRIEEIKRFIDEANANTLKEIGKIHDVLKSKL